MNTVQWEKSWAIISHWRGAHSFLTVCITYPYLSKHHHSRTQRKVCKWQCKVLWAHGLLCGSTSAVVSSISAIIRVNMYLLGDPPLHWLQTCQGLFGFGWSGQKVRPMAGFFFWPVCVLAVEIYSLFVLETTVTKIKNEGKNKHLAWPLKEVKWHR